MSWEAEASGGGLFSPCSHWGLKGMADGNGQVTGVSEGEDWNPQDPPHVTLMSQGPCWQRRGDCRLQYKGGAGWMQSPTPTPTPTPRVAPSPKLGLTPPLGIPVEILAGHWGEGA